MDPDATDKPKDPLARYHRQTLLPFVGREGQQRLADARVLLVGCGALGSVIAEQLVRAGVGFLRLVDRDVVEGTNLQRQVLFDEADAAAALPKAVAAAQRLAKVNSSVIVEPLSADVHAGNALDLTSTPAGPVHLLLDGTDNLETRYLLNDLSVKLGIPWVYGACVGTEGRIAAIVPGDTPCLRCLFPDPPAPSDLPTCDTAGVLAPAAAIVASLQVTAALKLLTGHAEALPRHLAYFDLWGDRWGTMDTSAARDPRCPCCGQRRFDYLDRPADASMLSLCGRNAVQIRPPPGQRLSLDDLAQRLIAAGHAVERTPWFLRTKVEASAAATLTAFPDGRLLIQGTSDFARARSIVARFIGS